MKITQKQLMRTLRAWNIADAKCYVAGKGYNVACKLWKDVLVRTRCCSVDEIVSIICCSIRHPKLVGFGKHDINTAKNQVVHEMETILTF